MNETCSKERFHGFRDILVPSLLVTGQGRGLLHMVVLSIRSASSLFYGFYLLFLLLFPFSFFIYLTLLHFFVLLLLYSYNSCWMVHFLLLQQFFLCYTHVYIYLSYIVPYEQRIRLQQQQQQKKCWEEILCFRCHKLITGIFCFVKFAASRMSSSHASPQVCRPHFHAPLHPWLSEPKSLASGSPWGSPFACPQDPQDKVQVQSHQSGQHLFSFPPTPPKDSTPDSVQTGPTEYQVNIFSSSTVLSLDGVYISNHREDNSV